MWIFQVKLHFMSLTLSLSLTLSHSLSLVLYLYFSPLTLYLWTFLSLLNIEKHIFITIIMMQIFVFLQRSTRGEPGCSCSTDEMVYDCGNNTWHPLLHCPQHDYYFVSCICKTNVLSKSKYHIFIIKWKYIFDFGGNLFWLHSIFESIFSIKPFQYQALNHDRNVVFLTIIVLKILYDFC